MSHNEPCLKNSSWLEQLQRTPQSLLGEAGDIHWLAVAMCNTYALFAELFTNLTGGTSRAGVILPTGIATDATTAPYFASLIQSGRLAPFTSFENEAFIFPSIHHSFRFCCWVLSSPQLIAPEFCFFLEKHRADVSA